MKTTQTLALRAKPLFEPVALRHTDLPNRIIRSATYEGYGDANGTPHPDLANLYSTLAAGGVGSIITGFVYVSPAGRAMQPGQCGLDADDKIAPWQNIVDRVRRKHADLRLFMQIAHTGRQTRRQATGLPVPGVSSRRCSYFKQQVRVLDHAGIEAIIREFAETARRAKEAGFDGVQVHAAHGYLVHQFLSPWTNTRQDQWSDGPLFLEKIIRSIRERNGADFPVLVKLSWADDNKPGIDLAGAMRSVKRLEALNVDAVEISYGTMEYALNIIRGACPADVILKINPLFGGIPRFARRIWKTLFLPAYIKHLIPFAPAYNVEAALNIKAHTSLPIISTGGFRSLDNMLDGLDRGLAAISLCRPLICEPHLPHKLRKGESAASRCTNCNLCTAYCDSENRLRCYQNGKGATHANS